MLIDIIFLVILVAIIFTLLKYTQEGDILTLRSKSSIRELHFKYPTKDAIVNRLHSLLIYKSGYVKWNRFMIMALFVALIITRYFREDVKLADVLVISTLIFFAIDIPNRWGASHVYSGIIEEGTILSGWYHSLP